MWCGVVGQPLLCLTQLELRLSWAVTKIRLGDPNVLKKFTVQGLPFRFLEEGVGLSEGGMMCYVDTTNNL